jgi:cytochrome c5
MKSALTILFLFLISDLAFAIDPVYEGANGIREKVFATNCLACHSSDLTGAARNGAPSSVNYDTYEETVPNADLAIAEMNEGAMPPFGSGLPLLNQEQITAMLAWQSAGFPKTSPVANYSYDNAILTLPVVNVGDQKYYATLRLTPFTDSPTGIGFLLESAEQTTASLDNEATYFPETGQVILPFVDLIQNDISQGQVSAELALVPDSNPMLFILTSYTPIP